MSGLYEEVLRIAEDIEDLCWGIRHDLLEGALSEEEALRELLRLLRIHLAELLDLRRELEQPDGETEGEVEP